MSGRPGSSEGISVPTSTAATSNSNGVTSTQGGMLDTNPSHLYPSATIPHLPVGTTVGGLQWQGGSSGDTSKIPPLMGIQHTPPPPPASSLPLAQLPSGNPVAPLPVVASQAPNHIPHVDNNTPLSGAPGAKTLTPALLGGGKRPHPNVTPGGVNQKSTGKQMKGREEGDSGK